MSERHFAVSAVGADRPGIVAGVTGALVELGCNLEDTSMTVLRGRFAMVLIVAGPERLEAASVESTLRPVAGELGLAVWVHDVEELEPSAVEGESWAVSVHGADHPGIVHEVAAVLAEAGVNIVDLSTRVLSGDQPVYAMILEVILPPGTDPPALEERLAVLSTRIGVACSMHPSGADIL
jgi:glycine cleavage system transcriptional repressor